MPCRRFPTGPRLGYLAAVVIVQLACGGCGDSDMISPFWFPSGVVVADFDGDGRADVALAMAYVDGSPPHPGSVWIYRQSAPGVFDAPADYRVGPDPWGLSAGDFDGDGRMDLVAATPATVAPQPGVISNSGGISILRQDPTRAGSFLPSLWVDTGGMPYMAAIAQLTADNLADVVVADDRRVDGGALLLPQSSTSPGTLLAPVSLPAGGGAGDVAVADVNSDGRTDIVLAAYESVAVFHQRAGGGFDPVVHLSAGAQVSGVAAADLAGDGRTDIVAVNGGYGGTSGVTVLRQTSPGSFVAATISLAGGSYRAAVGDLDGDGIPDIAVVSGSNPSRVSVLLQSSMNRGQFAVGGVYGGNNLSSFIAIGDLNADGLNDIIVDDGPGVLLQRPAAPGTFESSRPLR